MCQVHTCDDVSLLFSSCGEMRSPVDGYPVQTPNVKKRGKWIGVAILDVEVVCRVFPCNRFFRYLCLVKLPPWWLFISRKFGASQAVPCCVFVTSLSCSLSCFAFVLSALVLSLSLNLQKVFWDEVTNPF